MINRSIRPSIDVPGIDYRAARMTIVIGAHIIRAFLRDQDPVIVSNGMNAFTFNWKMVQTYMRLATEHYGSISFII